MSTKDMLNVAIGELGYKEGYNNDTKYGDWYGLPNQPWCAMFVAWCANKAGILTTNSIATYPKVYKTASVSTFRTFYNTNRRALAPSENPESRNYPKPGDLVLFKKSHIGIVEKVEGSTLKTIEGNTSNMVARRSYSNFATNPEIDFIGSNHINY